MIRKLDRLNGLFAAAGFALLADVSRAHASAQTPTPPARAGGQNGGAPATSPSALPQGTSREQMWSAPTAEDWQKPCLITWQRTFEDALKVARETGRPVLACVNMDGEIASEHYAGVRYRQNETAALYEPYVCVIASVFRHTPRDYDEQGQRILCPRFGSVTCGEHIAIEPQLFEKYMDGRRIAPRHIMIEPEQAEAEVYDVFYAFDTASVFKTITDGVANRPPPRDIVRSDRPVIERVGSADVRDRIAVEQAFVRGDARVRRTLLESALKVTELDHVELLRLALFGLDVELARVARRALAESTTESAVDLIAEALRVPMESEERAALVAALDRLGETFPRAKTLAAVHRGLTGKSESLDLERWSQSLASAKPEIVDSYSLEARLEAQTRAAGEKPVDAESQLDLAESYLALATAPDTTRRLARLMLQDARAAALQAETLGASGWRVHAVVAVTSSQLGEFDEARRRAELAVRGLPNDPTSFSSLAVLELFADARQRAIRRASREKKEWPPEWLSDVHATFALLARHPLARDTHIATHYDFLRSLGATVQANQVLDAGLKRFDNSWVLHDRLRSRILADVGIDGLETTYERMLSAEPVAPNLAWFAGYASIVAAEFHRRAAQPDKAIESYARAIALYDRNILAHPESRESSDHYAALALAGRARIAFERDRLEASVDDILASFARSENAAATLDGLNLSPVDTAKQLRVKARDSGRADLAQRVQDALAKLDTDALRLPAFEREGPPTQRDPGANTPPTPPRGQ